MLGVDGKAPCSRVMVNCKALQNVCCRTYNVGIGWLMGFIASPLKCIPNVMGIALFSPPLDEKGNTERGLQFCEVKFSN